MLDIKNKGTITSKRVLNIAKILSYHKGEDVVVYNVKDQTPYYSYLVIVSANNERKLNGLKDSAIDALYTCYKSLKNVEGRNESRWIVVDGYDVIIHLIEERERERLNIDGLYSKCPHMIVDENTVIPETRLRGSSKDEN